MPRVLRLPGAAAHRDAVRVAGPVVAVAVAAAEETEPVGGCVRSVNKVAPFLPTEDAPWYAVMEPLQALSRFIYLCVLLAGPVAWILVVWLKRRAGRRYEGRQASAEEILGELKTEYAPVLRTVVRTHTEYLPFLFECIRENIDGGFEDPQVMSLLERIEHHGPNQRQHAMFRVRADGQPSEFHLHWTRDACDRIELRFQGPPVVIRALREYQRKIPKAVRQSC